MENLNLHILLFFCGLATEWWPGHLKGCVWGSFKGLSLIKIAWDGRGWGYGLGYPFIKGIDRSQEKVISQFG